MLENNKQKGVTLIITFFIMVIVLAVVLGISVILYSEIIVVRNMGNSVISFYSADSGIEKVLYYDRMILPAGAGRGLCSICSTCGTGNGEKSMDCENCQLSGGAGCASGACDDCTITFNTFPASGSPDYFDYNIQAKISMDGLSPRLEINSTGSFINVSRAINVFISDATAPAPAPPPTAPASEEPPPPAPSEVPPSSWRRTSAAGSRDKSFSPGNNKCTGGFQ